MDLLYPGDRSIDGCGHGLASAFPVIADLPVSTAQAHGLLHFSSQTLQLLLQALLCRNVVIPLSLIDAALQGFLLFLELSFRLRIQNHARRSNPTKRDRIYVFNRNKKNPFVFRIYDVKAGQWIDPQPKSQPGGPEDRLSVGSNRSCAHYDAAIDVVLLSLNPRDAKKPGFYVYDPNSNQWTTDPVTNPKKGRNSFYDPKLNAHFFFDAGDSRTTPGNIWVYRYKHAGSKK